MTAANRRRGAERNVALYPWFRFLQSLAFWQAIWFLYFQSRLSASEAILLYVVYDVGVTILEVPSGYLSDRVGRRFTLIACAAAGFGGSLLLAVGGSFEVFVAAQLLLGANIAFVSGTDSALLYESLHSLGQQAEIELHELKAWRHSFVALAISAVSGGLMALYSAALPFAATAVAFAGVFVVAFSFSEPPHSGVEIAQGGELARLRSLRSKLSEPVLVWLFVLSVAMYVFSHVPFVFGQPFILEALDTTGFQAEAPLVSGIVTATMMMVSVLTSLVSPRLRRRVGLATLVLLAFALQIAVSATLALTGSAIAIAVLFLRMVPDSMSRPFIQARIQPLLSSESRATYLSLQSFCGRILFAVSLAFASRSTSAIGEMPYADLQRILTWYVVSGVVCLGILALAARRIPIESPDEARTRG